MATVPIVSGTMNLAQPWRPFAITVTNPSNTQPATVTVTGPDGNEVWACTLGPKGSATFGAAISSDNELLPAGLYTIAVTGTVNGSLSR